MSDLEALDTELREAITQLLVPLQTTRTVDRSAFDRVERAARSLARSLKGSDLIRKSLLNEMYVAARVIRTEAEYIKHESANLQDMAAQIEMIFGLILRGESCDDRRPGIPRIV